MKMKLPLTLFTLTFFTLQTITAQWLQVGSDIDGEDLGENSGYSVSLSSDGLTVAIGAPDNEGNGTFSGQARIYKYIAGMWVQQGSDIDGEAVGDRSGGCLSLSGDGLTVAIGAIYNDGNVSAAGHVRVYKIISGTWVQQGSDIDGEAADNSGYSVSLSSDGLTVAIGAPYNNGNGIAAGHVRIYKYIAGTWVQQGSDLDGEEMVDYSGYSVSLSSDGLTVAIGAPNNSGNGTAAGHVRIYKYTSGTWVQQGSDIDGEVLDDKSGTSVSLSGDGLTVAIGAPNNDGNGALTGHVRIYKYIAGTWVQQGSDIDGEAVADHSGSAVSISSDGLTVAIGASDNDGNGSFSGHVRVYKYIAGTWAQQGNDIDGEDAIDISGTSVSLSSDGLRVAIGAPYNNANGLHSGHVRIYEMGGATSIETDNQALHTKIYPNPTTGIIHIELLDLQEETSIEVRDILGRTVLKNLIISEKGTINLAGKENGIYILTIKNGDRITTQKIVLNK